MLIRQRREALGLSLYALEWPPPKLFSSEAMRKIEQGKRMPNFEMMLRIYAGRTIAVTLG